MRLPGAPQAVTTLLAIVSRLTDGSEWAKQGTAVDNGRVSDYLLGHSADDPHVTTAFRLVHGFCQFRSAPWRNGPLNRSFGHALASTREMVLFDGLLLKVLLGKWPSLVGV
jgi:hypothetical protein